ncbi:hypothetical protein ZWY2020_010471 [Hordeum vulgare]|nr:hypothetical protein ZWY2020_006922 [Hordeum vulgare]KAI4973040.1 hypothetical protein ZWY2020_010471 [Hordeum vulgare]
MASSSKNSFPSSLFALNATEKLRRGNDALWRATVLSAIRGAQMANFLDVDQAVPSMTIEVTTDDGKTKTKARTRSLVCGMRGISRSYLT